MKVMVDLETLGNTPGSVIVALGAVEFGLNGLGREFYQRIDVESSVRAGLKLDASTVLWWFKQGDKARLEMTKPGKYLAAVLQDFTAFLQGDSKVEIWGNGAAFDNVLLGCAYRAIGLQQPWAFWNDRCYRTLKGLYSTVPAPKVGVAHNALDDAKSQALHLIDIIKFAIS